MKLAELQGETLAGRFRLEELLGQGGYGAVFEAVQLSVGRRCAVKVLFPHLCADESTVARFRTEAKTTSRLTHPNSVVLYDFGRDDDAGLLFLAMELLDGRDLTTVLRSEGPLGVEETVHVVEQAAGSLQEAHDLGLVHRDIKPRNIMLLERGNDPNYVKVIDFGIAKVLGSSRMTVSDLTQTGTIIGTPKYMAPEQIRDAAIDGRTDLYALAISTYQMLTGRTPFEEGTAMEIAGRQLAERPEPPRTFHPGLALTDAFEAVLLKALAKKPEHRFDTVTEFARALRAALDARAVPALDRPGPTQALDSVAGMPPMAADTLDDATPNDLPAPAAVDIDSGQISAVTTEPNVVDDSEHTLATMAIANPARPGNDIGGQSDGSTAEVSVQSDGGPGGSTNSGTLTAPRGKRAVPPVAWAAAAALVVVAGVTYFALRAGSTASAAPTSAPMAAATSTHADNAGAPTPTPTAVAPRAQNGATSAVAAPKDDASPPDVVPKAKPAQANAEAAPPAKSAKADVDAGRRDAGAKAKPAAPDKAKVAPKAEPKPTHHVARHAVEVRVIPWGTLYVDGHKVGGGTRHSLRLRSGRHRLVLKQSGQERARRIVDVSSGSSKIIELVAR